MVQARKEAPAETLPGIRSAWAKKSDVRLEGPCSQIVYTLALKHSLYRYIGPKVHTIWVYGPLGFVTDYEHCCAAGAGAPADRNP